MTADDSDLYRVEDGGSKVWMSPTAVEYAAAYFGPGRAGVQKMAEYLRLRHTMQTVALTSPTVPMSDLAQYLAAPSSPQQEYEGEAATGDAQQEQQGPPSDVALPDDVLPNYTPLD